MSLITWHSKPEVRWTVGCLEEVMERAAVEISRYKHADVISGSLRRRRTRRAKFTGVARGTRSDVIRRDAKRWGAVVKRALELRLLDNVEVTWHGIDRQLVVVAARRCHRKCLVSSGDVITAENELVAKVKAGVVLNGEVINCVDSTTSLTQSASTDCVMNGLRLEPDRRQLNTNRDAVLFSSTITKTKIVRSTELTLWRPLLPYGYNSYKASCTRPCSDVICNFWHPSTLTLRAERQSARMSKITNDGLTRFGTGCFIAAPIWQQRTSKGWYPGGHSLYLTSDGISLALCLTVLWSTRFKAGPLRALRLWRLLEWKWQVSTDDDVTWA